MSELGLNLVLGGIAVTGTASMVSGLVAGRRQLALLRTPAPRSLLPPAFVADDFADFPEFAGRFQPMDRPGGEFLHGWGTGMQAAVIISTYNSPRWLELVLWGYAGQTCRRFELIVADDGSTAETKQVIDRFAATAMPVKHVWHPDSGFRKCTILNRAITAAEADYLIFSDGDCIPRSDFVATHLALREPKRFLSGGTVWLPQELSQRIELDDVVAGRATDLEWLRLNGLRQGLKGSLRLGRHPRLQLLCDRLTPTHATLNGHNTSAWRTDIVAAGGFDERMGYGGLDRELGERLVNAGVRGKQVRHRAVCVHLHHERGYESADMWRHNDAIRRETRQLGRMATQFGIAQDSDRLAIPVPPADAELVDDRRTARRAA